VCLIGRLRRRPEESWGCSAILGYSLTARDGKVKICKYDFTTLIIKISAMYLYFVIEFNIKALFFPPKQNI
jgi:hypothetical protein